MTTAAADPMADQVKAAVTHAHLLLTADGRVNGIPLPPSTELLSRTGPVWDRLKAWIDVAMTQEVISCAHVRGPRPVCGFLGMPGRICCAADRACYLDLDEAYARVVPENVCDGCGQPSPDGRLDGATLRMGPVLIGATLCTTCWATVPEFTPTGTTNEGDRP